MRCDCCNKVLSDYECSIKSVTTGEYLNTCTKCLSGLDIKYTGNTSLDKFHENEDYDEADDDYSDIIHGMTEEFVDTE